MQKKTLAISGAAVGVVAALLGGSLLLSSAAGAPQRTVWQHTEADTAADTRIQRISPTADLHPLCYSVSPHYPVNGDTEWFVVKVNGRTGYVSGSDAHLSTWSTSRC